MSKIKRAIIPAAGQGTRLRPLTYGIPKELLIVNNRPMIHYTVRECVKAEVSEIIIITNKEKVGLSRYLEKAFDGTVKFKYIIQEKPTGLVDAILMAERYLENDPFYILFPDIICRGKQNPLVELARCYEKYQSPVAALISWEDSNAQLGSDYGFIEYDVINENCFKINKLFGKGSRKRSVYKMTGRALWDASILKYLNNYRVKDDTGEYSEVPAIQRFVVEENYYGIKLIGTFYDCGTLNGFKFANRDFARDSNSSFHEDNKKDLSVVIPVFNEEHNLNDLHKRLSDILPKISKEYEIIFVDDGSVDNSVKIIESLSKSDDKIRGIRLVRNFGQHVALSAGLRHARGAVVVTMDADLQNPPEEIPNLLNKLAEGYDLVWGNFQGRRHSFFRRVGSEFAKYILMKILGQNRIHFSTFRAINGKLVEKLNQLNEQNRFLDGLLIWLGAKTETVKVKHDPRKKGETKYNIRKLIRLWADMVTSFSDLPLKLATIVGIFFSVVGFILSGVYFFMKILFDFPVPGFASLIIAIMLFAGIQLFCIGIIGEYVARIFIESKNRPFYIIDKEFGSNDESRS